MREKVKNLFNYVLNLKGINDNAVKNISFKDKNVVPLSNYPVDGISYEPLEEDKYITINRSSKEIYEKIFKIYMYCEKEGDNIEVILGDYIFTWLYNGKKFQYPLITTRMNINYSKELEVFTLSLYDNILNLEVDFFKGKDVEIKELIKIKNKFDCEYLSIQDQFSINKYIKEVLDIIGSEGSIIEDIEDERDIKIASKPSVYRLPVILTRRVDNRLWNGEISNIINELDSDFPIPPAIQAIVEDKAVNDPYKEEFKEIFDDLLFPLSSNEEQREIVKKLKDNYGVVVQGPPGTGKSHSIANIICHLLANGKRILVTSQNSKALRVIMDKVPQELRALCVYQLGEDNGLKDIDSSIRKIDEMTSKNPMDYMRNIEGLEEGLKKVREKQVALNSKIQAIEDIEYKKIKYNGRIYEVNELAKWLTSEEKNNNWITEDLELREKCPINDSEMIRFQYLVEKLTEDDINKVNSYLENAYLIPKKDILINHINTFQSLKVKEKEFEERLKSWQLPEKFSINKDIYSLLELGEFQVKKINNSWSKNLLRYYHSGLAAKNSVDRIYLLLKCDLKRLADIKTELSGDSITLPEDMSLPKTRAILKKIIVDLSSKNMELSKIYRITHPKGMKVLSKIFINNKPIEDKEDIKKAFNYIEEKLIEENLVFIWNENSEDFNGKQLSKMDLEEVAYLEDALNYINMIVMWKDRYIDTITDAMGKIIPLSKIDWFEEDTYRYIRSNLNILEDYCRYRESKEFLLKLKLKLQDNSFLNPLKEAVENRSIISINSIYSVYNNYDKLSTFVKEYNLYFNKLNERLPYTCEKIINSFDKSRYKHINKAWKWKQLNTLLNRIHSLGIDSLIEETEKITVKEREIIRELVVNKAWYQQSLKTTQEKQKSLYCWLQAAKKIGKGRSKFYSKYMSMAQEEMEKCKDIIPVWIMPINKVIENLKVTQELFDVVIIDESSQCDLSSLSILMRGKRAIVVGDDKQISTPKAIGVDALVAGYVEVYLKDIPYSRWFDAETNIYSTVQRVFPARVMLKEHFRSVPEIINFSNDLCYNNEISPLRCREEESLIPIQTIFVEDGKKEEGTKVVNLKEAEAIVEQIALCCKDERYKGMTFGVISLWGEEQGEIIEEMLREKIGEKELISRKLLCGDAYSFQGDERDIIFLSMVVSENLKTKPLTKEADIKKFNVAASRAKNQMWLFHSMDIKDLNQLCVRYKLLKYCQNYEEEYGNYESNEFFKDVYKFFTDKGIKISTMTSNNKYSVDFLVEEEKKTIALQCCGGDAKIHKTVESFENQKMIASMGWKLFKIRESEFYRNPEIVLDKFNRIINELNIATA